MGLHMDIDGFGGMLIEQWIWMYVIEQWIWRYVN